MRWKGALTIVDCHCEGEMGRVITGGMPQVSDRVMFDEKPYLEEHPGNIRKMVLYEPRGAIWHNASLLLPSCHPEADMGFVIMERTEHPAMSASNAIRVATVLPETGSTRVEVAFGSMTFSMVEVADPGLAIEPSEARALCDPGQKFIRRPITGSRFTGAIDGLGKAGPCPAVIPALAGQALD